MKEFFYNYHPTTGEYVNKQPMEYDPIERNKLIPAYATDQIPCECQSSECNIFSEGKWIKYQDHRGEIVWNKDGEKITVDWIGKIPDSYYTQEPLFVLKEEKENELQIYIENTLDNGYVTYNIKMDATKQDLERLVEGYHIAQRRNETKMDIIDYNNKRHKNIPIDQVKNMIDSIEDFQSHLFWYKQDIREKIEACETKEQLEKIHIGDN
jgi:hypothetical protein